MKKISNNSSLKSLSGAWMLAVIFLATSAVCVLFKYYPEHTAELAVQVSNDTPLGGSDGQVGKVAVAIQKNLAAHGLTLFAKASDPNQGAALVAQRAIALAHRFSTDKSFQVLFDHLDLNDEDRDALINLMVMREVVLGEGLRANGIQQWSHDVRFVINGKMHDTSVYTGDVGFLDQSISDLYALADNQIRGLLGDDKFSVFQNYIDTNPYRVLADNMSSAAKRIDEPEFTQEQKEMFINAMASNNAFKSNYLDTEIPNYVINMMASIVTPGQLNIIAEQSITNAEMNRLSLLEIKKYQEATK